MKAHPWVLHLSKFSFHCLLQIHWTLWLTCVPKNSVRTKHLLKGNFTPKKWSSTKFVSNWKKGSYEKKSKGILSKRCSWKAISSPYPMSLVLVSTRMTRQALISSESREGELLVLLKDTMEHVSLSCRPPSWQWTMAAVAVFVVLLSPVAGTSFTQFSLNQNRCVLWSDKSISAYQH